MDMKMMTTEVMDGESSHKWELQKKLLGRMHLRLGNAGMLSNCGFHLKPKFCFSDTYYLDWISIEFFQFAF